MNRQKYWSIVEILVDILPKADKPQTGIVVMRNQEDVTIITNVIGVEYNGDQGDEEITIRLYNSIDPKGYQDNFFVHHWDYIYFQQGDTIIVLRDESELATSVGPGKKFSTMEDMYASQKAFAKEQFLKEIGQQNEI